MAVAQDNHSTGIEFILLGFPTTQDYQVLFFTFFLIIYLLTILGNLLLLLTLWTEPHLHIPMYFFLANLSVSEMASTSVTVPKLLAIFLASDRVISFANCFLQSYLFFFLGATECFLLAVMAYDRYLAICHPLRYPVLMSSKICAWLAFGSWGCGLITPFLPNYLIRQLQFCGAILDHFFCDVPPLLSLLCTDPYVSANIIFVSAIIIVLGSFSLICLSYAYILATVLRMSSSKGRQKAFSTCTAHLTVVSLYYSTVIFMYITPAARQSMNVNKTVAVVYCVLTPMLNPLIYSLRNADVKTALRRMMLRIFHVSRLVIHSGQ